MCGRFSLAWEEWHNVASKLGLDAGSEVAASYKAQHNIAPTDSHFATVRLPRREDRPDNFPVGRHPLATRRWLRDEAARVLREYLEHPCAVSSCPCMVHRLGLPPLPS
jgi:hypothetical protein